MLDELDIEERQRAWFKVLRFLQKFKTEASQKVEQAKAEADECFGKDYSSIKNRNKYEFT